MSWRVLYSPQNRTAKSRCATQGYIFSGDSIPRSSERGDELNFDEAAQLQEKLLLGRVAFREDVVMVIEKIERLRELESVLGDEGGLLRADRGIDLRVERCREERKFPERVSVGAGE